MEWLLKQMQRKDHLCMLRESSILKKRAYSRGHNANRSATVKCLFLGGTTQRGRLLEYIVNPTAQLAVNEASKDHKNGNKRLVYDF